MSYYSAIINDKGNIAVDDTILTENGVTSAGSKILDGFKSLFGAEVVDRLEKAGYVISGKTHVGEFGLDLVGEFSHYNTQSGSLAGAAASLVAGGSVKAALGVDMNGAPRRAAALVGVSFIKPTYGTVSRYGVISCAASGEQVGVYAKNADGAAEILGVIAGHDSKDGTSLPDEKYTYTTAADVKGKKVAVVKELLALADDETKKRVEAFAAALRKNGVEVEEISCNIFENANIAWQILMCAETCNNVSRYDGVKFGYRAEQYRTIDDLYTNSRTEGFNFLTKAVILYGSDVLSKTRYADCYDKSLRIRRIVADELKKLFENYAAVLTPVCTKTSYEAYDIKDAFEKVFTESVFTAAANLVGIPALVSGGVQLLGAAFGESELLSLAKCAESEGK